MQLNFLVPSSNEVVDNMRRGGIATRTAEPFVASQTLDNAARVMNTTIPEQDRQLISKAAHTWPLFFFFFFSFP